MIPANAPHPILLAAGGTGGHLFPATALADELVGRGCQINLVTDARGGGFGDRQAGLRVMRVASGGIAGKNIAARLHGAVQLGIGLMQSWRLMRRIRPLVAVGFGGYASLPPVLAAQQAGIPTILHEQNAVLGRTNRFLMKRASRLALSFENVRHADSMPAERRVLTGNPVRPAILAIADRPYRAPRKGEPIHLLVFAGSQGARAFGRIVPQGLALLGAAERQRIKIVQQCRTEDLPAAAEIFRQAHLQVELQPFFADMPERLDWAHLVLCRSGASTVAELTAAGRPALMVPLPNAIDDHQRANAAALESKGAGWVLPESEMTPQKLAERLTVLLSAPDRLERAAVAAKALGRRDAARRLADLVLSLLPEAGRARPAREA